MNKKTLLSIVLLSLAVQLVFAQEKFPKQEVRGSWIATVANIDWPSSNLQSSAEQLSELSSILDKLYEAGINTIFFQVRTECDALYNSAIEPWSFWLTGKQGKAPVPYYDPLETVIKEAHKRGMELHAWFNPYRAVKNVGDYVISKNHITVQHPDWILDFGKYKILNPGIPAVREYIISVIKDVLYRYAVDGIHFDDYFYPYTPKISSQDSLTFVKYGEKFSDINDWRRNNINLLIKQVYDSIQVINPAIKFGISPFGIIKNIYAGTNGFEAYNVLYCDPLTWIKDKTVDYLTPQLYWEIGHSAADYVKLLNWWSSAVKHRQLSIGMYASKFASPNYTGSHSEIENQIRMNRKISNVEGSVFFSAKSITNNWSNLSDSLKNNFYKYPALPPAMLWKDSIPPFAPVNLKAVRDSEGITLTWDPPMLASDGDPASYYVIYRFEEGEKIDTDDSKFIIKITNDADNNYKDIQVSSFNKKYTYVVTALDKLKNESTNKSAVIVNAKKEQ